MRENQIHDDDQRNDSMIVVEKVFDGKFHVFRTNPMVSDALKTLFDRQIAQVNG
ncbi:MAG: hypothetical protein R3C03_21985 [Pirellulaceae bacterium]